MTFNYHLSVIILRTETDCPEQFFPALGVSQTSTLLTLTNIVSNRLHYMVNNDITTMIFHLLLFYEPQYLLKTTYQYHTSKRFITASYTLWKEWKLSKCESTISEERRWWTGQSYLKGLSPSGDVAVLQLFRYSSRSAFFFRSGAGT